MNLTTEQIKEMRVAIAEKCGHVRDDICDCWFKDGDRMQARFIGHANMYVQLPNYPSDLNAMHEAEKSCILQTVEKSVGFRNALRDICCDGPRYEISDSFIWHATALQRAEAFCRTLKIGPWKE